MREISGLCEAAVEGSVGGKGGGGRGGGGGEGDCGVREVKCGGPGDAGVVRWVGGGGGSFGDGKEESRIGLGW